MIFASGTYGDGEFYRGLLGPGDYILCADGGAKLLLGLGITPHLALGDFDSIEIRRLAPWKEKGVPILTYPREKDKTDTELAVDYALDLGINRILLLGALGGRIDHTLANISLLVSLARRGVEAIIMERCCEIRAVTSELTLLGKAGDLLSIVPVTPLVEGITTEGLAYPLVNATLSFGSSRGISNIFCAERASVKVTSGLLLAIKLEQ